MNFNNEITLFRNSLPFYMEHEFDVKSQNKVYIYGAGFMGCQYASLLKKNGFEVISFFETNVTKEKIQGYCVTEPTLDEYPVIISSAKYYKEIRDILINIGYSEDKIISPYGMMDKFFVPDFEKAFNNFDDNLSKKTVIDKLYYLFNNSSMSPVSAYFDNIMFQNDFSNEIFVDCGAFDGETSIEFANITNNSYKKIYCFEPTNSSFEQLRFKTAKLERIELINKGVYSEDTVLEFKDFGKDQWNTVNDYFMGHEWNGPSLNYKIIKIPVTTLDSVFSSKNIEEYPTIVKMDIEGSEQQALWGMRKVINTSHPKLIICAYHKIEDYFTLAETIKEICPNYRLRLRHYTDNVLESIIFGEYQES